MTPEILAILNFVTLNVSIVAAIIGLGFYLEKRANNRMEQLENKMERDVLELEWAIIDQDKIQAPKEEYDILPDLREIAAHKFPLRRWN